MVPLLIAFELRVEVAIMELSYMETRIAAISIIVEDQESVERINQILHGYNQFIIGRMGIPYRKRDLAIISIVMEAPNDAISALSGKLGMLPNVTAKTVYSKLFPTD